MIEIFKDSEHMKKKMEITCNTDNNTSHLSVWI